MATLAFKKPLRPRRQPLRLAVITLTDQELVERAKTGDHNAFRILVERHEKNMARTVSGMLGPSSEVDDVVQEVFIRFFKALNRFRGDAAPSTFIKRIAINLSLDTLRRRKRLRKRFVSRHNGNEHLFESVDENVNADAFDRKRLVEAALSTLRPHHRSVIVLRLIDGYSTRETANILQVPPGTVLSRLSRASAKLRAVLEPILADET